MGTLKIVDRRITKILNTIDHILNKNFCWFWQEVWLLLQLKLFQLVLWLVILVELWQGSTSCPPCVVTVGIPSFTSTITVRKNYIFGKQILSILTLGIVLLIRVLVHLCMLMPSLLVVVLLLASITSMRAIDCGRILRAYRAPPGGSFVRLSFCCDWHFSMITWCIAYWIK